MNPQHQQKRKICQSCRLKLYLRPSFIVFFNFSHKRPTFAFMRESGYTLGFRRRIAHSGPHAETRGVSDGGGITTLGAFRTFTNNPGPGIRTANFAAFGSWSGGALEERRKPSGQRCAYACRCSEGVAAPLGFSLLLKLHLCAPRSGLSTLARCGGVTTALGMLCALSKCSVRSFQNGLHLCPHSGVGNIPTFPQRIAHNVSHVEGGSFSSEATVASDLPSDFYKYVNCINNSACRFCCNCFCGMVR